MKTKTKKAKKPRWQIEAERNRAIHERGYFTFAEREHTHPACRCGDRLIAGHDLCPSCEEDKADGCARGRSAASFPWL